MATKPKYNNNLQIVALVIAILAFGLAGVALLKSSSAAPSSKIPTGTIAVKTGSDLRFGGSVSFDTTVSSFNRGYVYESVVCSTNGRVVYQWSAKPGFTFPLIDQQGQGLEWKGESVSCWGEIIYRIDGQKPTIKSIASVSFDVSGQQ